MYFYLSVGICQVFNLFIASHLNIPNCSKLLSANQVIYGSMCSGWVVLFIFAANMTTVCVLFFIQFDWMIRWLFAQVYQTTFTYVQTNDFVDYMILTEGECQQIIVYCWNNLLEDWTIHYNCIIQVSIWSFRFWLNNASKKQPTWRGISICYLMSTSFLMITWWTFPMSVLSCFWPKCVG